MLQYFTDNKYKSIFANNIMPQLKYLCMVDKSSSSMPRSMHMHKDIVEVLLVYEGSGMYIIEGNKYTAKKGDLIFFNSNVLHDEFGGLGTDLETYTIGFSHLHLKHLPKNQLLPNNYYPIISLDEYFPDILNLLELMQHNIEDTQMKEFCHTLTQAFIVKICSIIERKGVTKENSEHSLSIKIKNYIDNHYKENISLEKIAQAVTVNRYYLAHTFKATTGFSPMQYVTRRRIGEAQNLLINTDMSITQIAASVGYNNSNYFQNVFRQNVGLTPGSYRQKWKF